MLKGSKLKVALVSSLMPCQAFTHINCGNLKISPTHPLHVLATETIALHLRLNLKPMLIYHALLHSSMGTTGSLGHSLLRLTLPAAAQASFPMEGRYPDNTEYSAESH